MVHLLIILIDYLAFSPLDKTMRKPHDNLNLFWMVVINFSNIIGVEKIRDYRTTLPHSTFYNFFVGFIIFILILNTLIFVSNLTLIQFVYYIVGADNI